MLDILYLQRKQFLIFHMNRLLCRRFKKNVKYIFFFSKQIFQNVSHVKQIFVLRAKKNIYHKKIYIIHYENMPIQIY